MDLAPVCLQSWARDHESGRRGQISIFHRWVDAPPARESVSRFSMRGRSGACGISRSDPRTPVQSWRISWKFEIW